MHTGRETSCCLPLTWALTTTGQDRFSLTSGEPLLSLLLSPAGLPLVWKLPFVMGKPQPGAGGPLQENVWVEPESGHLSQLSPFQSYLCGERCRVNREFLGKACLASSVAGARLRHRKAPVWLSRSGHSKDQGTEGSTLCPKVR